MLSGYGVASGLVRATDDLPIARNTSSKFDLGRNFANKLWNATRFALKRVDASHRAEHPVDLGERPFADRWIVARLSRTVTRLEQALSEYQFNAFADVLYDFVWHDVCDRYLEIIKPTVDDDHDQQVVLAAVLDAVLRIMHPVCPFVTETLWPHVGAARCGDVDGLDLPPSELCAGAAWPQADPTLDDVEAIESWQRADQLIASIRAVRGAQSVAPRKRITVYAPTETMDLVGAVDGAVEVLAGIGELNELGAARPDRASPITFEGAEILLAGLVDDIDLDQERDRLHKIIEGKTKQIAGFRGRLSNEGFLANAKPEIVADTRAMLTAAEADLTAAETALANLG
jgi:valyl-tRNA synthetase